jgi:flagellum-specific ATP synthase
MTAAIDGLSAQYPVARLSQIRGSYLRVSGLPRQTRLGDTVRLGDQDKLLSGEIIALSPDGADVLVDGNTEGLAIGMPVRLLAGRQFAPDDSWIGRVIDPDGRPLDGRPLLPGVARRSIHQPPPKPHARRGLGARIETGFAVLNTLLPVVRGQRIGLFAGSGVGKSTLLGDLARGIEADVIVIGLVGERGRELRHFIEDVLGVQGMARSVVVAATSDRAPQVRRQCALSATAVAEHFRDNGLHVLLLLDSVTRFCEAHREVAGFAGEPGNLRGFPPSTAGAIANLCERAGPGANTMGDITAIYSVLVAGSDMEEPVADMLRGVLDGHIILDRSIAERGRFPAIDVLRSVSRALPSAATRVENDIIRQARALMGTYDRASLMVQAGLYVAGSDPQVDKAIACHAAVEQFLAVKDKRQAAAHFAALKLAINA